MRDDVFCVKENVVANDTKSATTWCERGDLKPPCAAARLAALTIHLAVPKEPFGLTHFLRFFDRCGKCEPAFSATGSAGTLFPRHVIHCRSGVQVSYNKKEPIRMDGLFLGAREET